MKEKSIYSRTKEDLLDVLEFKGEACQKLAKKLKETKKTLKENEIKISSLRYEIRQLRLEIRRLKNKER